MRDNARRQIEEVIHLRNELAAIEAKRSKFPTNTPPEIFEEFMIVLKHLEKAEKRVNQTCNLIMGNVNQIRKQVQQTLGQYIQLDQKMAEFEELFLTNIIRPGNTLRQATLQKDYLKREFERIKSAIEREEYASQEALEADILYVLQNGDTIGKEEDNEGEKDQFDREDFLRAFDEIGVDEVVDAIRFEKIVTEFKQIVLPAVHPDTSDTSAEVFKLVFDVYEKKDFLLMEAYLIEYKGDVVASLDSDPLINLEGLLEKEEYYNQVLSQLNHRFARLKEDMTTQEVKDPDKVRTKLQQQRIEILKRIQDEARQINQWREKIENLQ